MAARHEIGFFQHGQGTATALVSYLIYKSAGCNSGGFFFGVDPKYPKQLVILRRGVLYWQTGYNFNNFPQMIGYGILRKFNFNYFSNESQSCFTYTRNDYSSSWIEMGSSGTIGIFWADDQGLTFLSADPCEADQSEYVLRGCAIHEPSNCKGGDVFKQTSGTMNSWSNIDNSSQRAESLIDELKSSIAIFDKISNGKKDHDLPLFSLSSIEIATDYFSNANEIGKGGFGPVYRSRSSLVAAEPN